MVYDLGYVATRNLVCESHLDAINCSAHSKQKYFQLIDKFMKRVTCDLYEDLDVMTLSPVFHQKLERSGIKVGI